MKIYFRHRDQNIASPELDINKTYTVGRSLNCDIQLPIPQVSRYQGVIFFQDGLWRFRDESTQTHTVTALSDSVSVDLKNGLTIFLDSYLANEQTHVFHDDSVKVKSEPFSKHRLIAATSGFIFLAIFIAGFFFFYKQPYNSKTLMGFAENKILKFELKVKKDVLNKIKADADLKEEDFKETVGFCTGFLVEKNVLLTAHHCVSPPPGLTIEKDFILKTFDNREILPKRILGFDFVKDFIFIEVEGFNDNPFFKFAENTEIGQKVYTIGNVSGEGLAIREGIISGETEDPNDPAIKYIRFSAAASPGNSGGPLLNEKGEVVALVSRKNIAENYNIGIAYTDLKKGFSNFVLSQDKKTIQFDSKSSDLGRSGIEYYLSKTFRLPLIDKLDSKPNLQEVLQNFKVNFEVPFDFKDSDEKYFSNFHKVAKEKITLVNEKAKKENLPGYDWEEQTTADLPYVIPSTTSDSNLPYKLIGNQFLVPKFLGLIGNSGFMGYEMTLNDWKKEKFYYYSEGFMATRGQLIEERIESNPEDKYLVYSSIKDSKESMDISRFFVSSPDFSIVYLDNAFSEPNNETKREALVKKTMKDIFIGPEGAIASLKFFPFLRPKAKSDFKIKDFPYGLNKLKVFEDRHKRKWNYYVANFYDTFFVELFCNDTPNATHCLTTLQDGSFEKVNEDVVKNFVSFELSEKYSLMDYFSFDKINDPNFISYLNNSDPFKEFSISTNAKNEVEIELKNFNYRINLGPLKNLVNFRFIPGIKYDLNSKKGNWQSFGVQFTRSEQTKKGQKFEICTAGIQFDELKYNSMINKDHSLQKSLRNVASDYSNSSSSLRNKTKSNEESVWKSDLGKDELNWSKQAYGTCQNLIKDSENSNTFRANDESRPYSGSKQQKSD